MTMGVIRQHPDGRDLRSRADGLAKSNNDLINSTAHALERPLLSVVVPTRDEAENIEELVGRLEQVAPDLPVEIVFVDDSNDGTPEVIEEIGAQCHRDVALIHRPPDQRDGGLGGAVIEGLRAARAPWVCVMDGDLQHPPELVPELLDQAQRTDADVVVASRHRDQGNARGLGVVRAAISQSLDTVARLAFPDQLRDTSDPLSGFFLVRRQAIDLDKLRPRGFKILLEILVRTPGLRVSEVSFEFGKRYAGESKASVREGLRYLSLLWHLRYGENALRFVRFCLVGAFGLLVNSLLLAFATDVMGIHYLVSAMLATQGSTLWNFTFTEFWVFSDRQEKWGRMHRLVMFLLMNNAALGLRGPMMFTLTSGLGVHYLVSNLVSLIALTFLRYALADTWIWGRARSFDRLRTPPMEALADR